MSIHDIMRCMRMLTYYDKSPREKVITIWSDDRSRIAEVVNFKRDGRWLWECRACRSESCDHVRQARAWLRERKKQQEELWRRMDAMYPAEPARPHVKFAPCPD